MAQDAPRPTEKAPKLASESSTEEVKGKPTEMPQWSKLKNNKLLINFRIVWKCKDLRQLDGNDQGKPRELCSKQGF